MALVSTFLSRCEFGLAVTVLWKSPVVLHSRNFLFFLPQCLTLFSTTNRYVWYINKWIRFTASPRLNGYTGQNTYSGQHFLKVNAPSLWQNLKKAFVKFKSIWAKMNRFRISRLATVSLFKVLNNVKTPKEPLHTKSYINDITGRIHVLTAKKIRKS